jgi:hypothetical protein
MEISGSAFLNVAQFNREFSAKIQAKSHNKKRTWTTYQK